MRAVAVIRPYTLEIVDIPAGTVVRLWIYHKQLTLHGTRAALQRDYQRGIDLAVSGVIELAPLLTHEFPLSRARDTFAALEGHPKALKVALTPTTS